MDATIASPPTHGWELLAQLALCGQNGTTSLDEASFTQQVVALLRQYLPCGWGVIVTLEEQRVRTAGSWGLNDDVAAHIVSAPHNGTLAELEDGAVTLPLRAGPAEIGLLLLAPANDSSAVTIDQTFYDALAAQIGLLLHSRRKNEIRHRADELRALVSRHHDLVGKHELPALLTTVLGYAVGLMDYAAGAIYTAGENNEAVQLLAAYGEQLPEMPALATLAMRKHSTHLSRHAQHDPQLQQMPAAIAVPLDTQDQPIGVLVLRRAAADDPMSDDDRYLIASFAAELALLVRNGAAFAQQQQRARELFVLYENSQVISSSSQLETMLNRVAENIALVLQADYCAIHLLDVNEPNTLHLVASYSEQNQLAPDSESETLHIVDIDALFARLPRNNPLIIEELDSADERRRLIASLCTLNCRSAMLMPLRSKDHTVGLLVMGSVRGNRTGSQAERNLIQVLADQVATAVVNRQFHEAEQKRSTELQQLQELSRHLSADLSLDETLDAILGGVQTLVKFSGARIALYDPATQVSRLAVQRGLRAGKGMVCNGLTDWLARHRRSIRLGETREASLYQHENTSSARLALASGSLIRSYLGVALLLGDEFIGTLELVSHRPTAFSADDERLLSIVAGQAAQAIINARRYEQADEHLRARIEQLRALQRISNQLAITLDQNEILAFVLEQALKATTASHGLIALRRDDAEVLSNQDAQDDLLKMYFPEGGQEVIDAMHARSTSDLSRKVAGIEEGTDEAYYRIIEAAGYNERDRALLIEAPINPQIATAYQALQRGEPELTDDLSDEESFATRCPTANSALAAPIWYEASIVGVVMLLAPMLRGFDHDAVEFVRALADQAAVAIGNAQRYAELEQVSKLLQRRASILNDVLEIGQALRADRRLDNLLEQIGYSVMESADFRTIIFYLGEQHNARALRAVAGAGIPLNELDRIAQEPIPEVLAMRYLDSRFRMGRSFFIPAERLADVEAGFDTAAFSYYAFDDERRPGEWQRGDRLFVPLYSTEGRLLGLMFVGDPVDRQRPTRRTVEPLEIFADQASIAIENYHLFSDAQSQAEQMTALYQVGTAATSTVDLDTLLARVYQEIVAYLGTPDVFSIASYLPESAQIRMDLCMQRGQIVEQYHKSLLPKGGLTAMIIDEGTPILIDDWLTSDPALTGRAIKITEEVRSWLGVPLRSQDQVLGVLTVQSHTPHAFSKRDQQFLSALANHLAVAMEKANLFLERERRIAELDVINRIGNIINSTLDLPQMLRQVYTCLTAFLTVDAGFIYLYRAENNEITLSFEVDEDQEVMTTETRAVSPQSLTQQIIQTRRPLLLRDLREDPLDAQLIPGRFGNEERLSASWLGVPLLAGEGGVVGVLSVQSYTPGLYGERETALLNTVASQLALGVQNALLFAQAQGQVKQLALINRVSLVAATTLEHDRIYQAVVEAMAQASGADQSRLVIYHREAGVAPIVAEYMPTSVPAEVQIQLMHNPAVDWLDEHKTTLVSLDAQNDPLFVVSHEVFRALDIRSIALVPLTTGGEVIGAVGIDFVGRYGYFSKQDQELCQTIANQTATALQNARLFAKVQANANALEGKVGELTTLLDAARILSSLLRPDEVLDKLMDLVSRQLGVTTVALWTINAEGVLTPAAMDGIPAEIAQTMKVPVGQGFTGRVAEAGVPIIVDDVEDEGGSLYPEFQRRNHLISFMGVPVVYRGRTIGVLSVMTSQRRQFSDDEMQLLVGLADQAATALQNAKLFEERERRINELTTINKISAAVNATLRLDDLLMELHRGIGEIIDVSTSLIALYDEQSTVLTYPISYDEGRRMFFNPAPLSEGTNSWVIRNRQPLLLYSHEEAAQLGLNTLAGRIGREDHVEQSFLVAPIMYGDHVLGVINIQSYEPRAFDENDLRFLTTVTNQAAVAINNAKLFSEVVQNASEMRTLFEVTQHLAGTLDPHEAKRLVAQAALKLMGADMCAVLRLDGNGRFQHQVLADRTGIRHELRISVRRDGLTNRLLRRDVPLAISDLVATANPNPEVIKLGARGILGMAIGSRDERLGVIWVGTEHPHEWSEHQMSLLSILANQASQALKSAHLFQMEQARRRMADTLHDVAQSFTSTLALDEIQTLILDQLARVVPYDSAAVLLRDEGYGYLHITEARGLQPNHTPGQSFEIEAHPLFAVMAIERQPVLIADVSKDRRFASMTQIGWKVRTWIGAPLLVDNELIGVLAVGSATAGAYDAEAAEVTFALASQASQAIQNARLFDQVSNLAADLERRVVERTAALEDARVQITQEKERLEAVHAITLKLTAMLDLNEIIEDALEMVSRHMGVSRGSIMLKDQQDGKLICRAVLHDTGNVHRVHIPITFDRGEGLASWVMQYQEPACIADVRLDARWVQVPGRADDVRSAAAVPLMNADTALGVLILSSTRVGYFTEAQIRMLETIASEVAIAINNAQLYGYINDMASRLAETLENQREEASKSRAILQSVTEGVIVLDPEGRISLFNPAAEQVLLIAAADVMERPMTALCHQGATEDERKRAELIYNGLSKGLEHAKESKGIYSLHLDLADPTQVIAVNLAPVIGPGGQRYGDVAVLRDITREIESDRAKRQFISDVSHELRTPLTAIKGYVDVLLLSSAHTLNEEQVSYLNIVKTNTNRLKSLIDDILDISRLDGNIKLNFAQVELDSIIHDVVQSLRMEAEHKQMQVTVDLAEQLPALEADQKRLTQVIFNLYSNALKYTYPQGRISVRAYLNRASMIQVDVEDNGVGMTPEQCQKLFRPFYRADNPLREVAGGTGLGLSIAKSIVEQHGGEMWVTSELGRGSIFSFIIPLQQPITDGDDE